MTDHVNPSSSGRSTFSPRLGIETSVNKNVAAQEDNAHRWAKPLYTAGGQTGVRDGDMERAAVSAMLVVAQTLGWTRNTDSHRQPNIDRTFPKGPITLTYLSRDRGESQVQ